MKRKTLYAIVMAGLLAFGGTALADETLVSAEVTLIGNLGALHCTISTTEGELERALDDPTRLVTKTHRDASFEFSCDHNQANIIKVGEPISVSPDAQKLEEDPTLVKTVMLKDDSGNQLCASSSDGCDTTTTVENTTYLVAIEYDSSAPITEGYYEVQVTVTVVDE